MEKTMYTYIPEEEDFNRLLDAARADNKTLLPVWLELLCERSPIELYQTLQSKGVPSFVFESVEDGNRAGRYSYIGVNPRATLTCRHGVVTLHNGTDNVRLAGDPREAITRIIEGSSALLPPGIPPFIGGWVGHFGFEAVRLLEPSVPDAKDNDLDIPDVMLMEFRTIIAVDHVQHKLYIITCVEADQKHGRFGEAYLELFSVAGDLDSIGTRPETKIKTVLEITSNMTKGEFEAMVIAAKERIVAGDIFQVVLSQRFSSPFADEALDLYRHLRQRNPSPYLFLVDFGDWQLVGSSPEILVEVIGDQIRICPIAGTRGRGATEDEDLALARELIENEKERAEHVMLVDLGRNDVGRAARPGTVRVPKNRLMRIVRYSTVMHIVTDVLGTLGEGISALMAVLCGFPAGTLSGAPKIQAMKIIHELEPTRRGPYGGCVGFYCYTGSIETAIIIRTAVIKDRRVSWQAGAGIVYDSDPTAEYEETVRKGASIRTALEQMIAAATLTHTAQQFQEKK